LQVLSGAFFKNIFFIFDVVQVHSISSDDSSQQVVSAYLCTARL